MKTALENDVEQNYLWPMHHTQTTELKDVMHHRKKMTGRKLGMCSSKKSIITIFGHWYFLSKTFLYFSQKNQQQSIPYSRENNATYIITRPRI